MPSKAIMYTPWKALNKPPSLIIWGGGLIIIYGGDGGGIASKATDRTRLPLWRLNICGEKASKEGQSPHLFCY